jgi:acetyltransferase-like isoleucine patch superfamily enzyme
VNLAPRWLQPPFYCDYGSNIRLGERVFFNFNCVVLDVCEVRIGDFSQFGPGIQILTLFTRWMPRRVERRNTARR